MLVLWTIHNLESWFCMLYYRGLKSEVEEHFLIILWLSVSKNKQRNKKPCNHLPKHSILLSEVFQSPTESPDSCVLTVLISASVEHNNVKIIYL